jgi:hypothetical protein
MAHYVGHRPGPTVRPSAQILGRACYDGFRIPDSQRGKIGLPAPLLPAALRRSVETHAMVSLAGELTERLTSYSPAQIEKEQRRSGK